MIFRIFDRWLRLGRRHERLPLATRDIKAPLGYAVTSHAISKPTESATTRLADLRLARWAGEVCRNQRDDPETFLLGLVADRPRGCEKVHLRQASYESWV
jgi:hypothetical protein